MTCAVSRARGRRVMLVATTAGVILAAFGVVPAEAEPGATITVDSTSDVADLGGGQTVADLPGADGRTSLREAVLAANNTDGPQSIVFAIPTSDPGFDGRGFTIGVAPATAADELRLTDDNTTVDATTQPGGFSITVEGSGQTKTAERVGLVIASSGNTVRGLGWQLYGSAIRITSGTDNLVTAVTVHACNNGVQLHHGHNALTDSTISGNDRSPVTMVNSLGGTVSGNTITDNALSGVFIANTPTAHVRDNLISGNTLGISLTDSSSGSATGNTITGNRDHGVQVGNAGFTVRQNAIFGNDGLGIDLLAFPQDEFGVSRNTREGPNYPDHLSAVTDGEATVVQGRVDYDAPQSVMIELFTSSFPDPSGHGEGETLMATANPDAKGRFTVTLPGDLTGQHVTTTATAPNGTTSEFSTAVPVTTGANQSRHP